MKNIHPLVVAALLAVAWIVYRNGWLDNLAPNPTPVLVPTAAVYIYEKDDGSVPPPVLAAISKLNQQGIQATTFEEDTTDAEGQVPDQYKAAVPAAREAGLPALVVSASDKVLRTVKDPKTEEQVLEATK